VFAVFVRYYAFRFAALISRLWEINGKMRFLTLLIALIIERKG
jgi:hypothetical protein